MPVQKKIKQQKTTSERADSVIVNKNRKKDGFLPAIVLTIICILLYINTLQNDYALDDSIVVIKNSFTQKGTSGIGDIFKYDTFTGFWAFNDTTKTSEEIAKEKKLLAGGRYRPLSLVTFALEVELFGKDYYDENGKYIAQGCPAIQHSVNILMYIFCVLLLFIVLKRLFPINNQKWYLSLSFLSCLIFAIHPIHTEAVANIKGRDELMTLIGSLSALWFSIKYVDTKKIRNLVFSGLALLFGLLSKENAITFLALIPLTLFYFTSADKKQIIKSMIPLLLVTALFLLLRSYVLGIEHNVQTKELMNDPFINMDVSTRFGTIFVTLLMYLKLLIIPHPLTFDYYPWQIPKTEITDITAIFSLLIYFALGIYAIYGMIKKKNIVSYSIWFFLIPLSIVSNIFFCVGTLMNERFIFISSIGFCIFVAWIFSNWLPKIIKSAEMSKYITIVFMLIAIVLCSIKTVGRNSVWKNDTTLFTNDVEISKNSAKSNCSAGGKLLEKAQSETVKDNKELHDALCKKSIGYLNHSIKIYPRYVDALNLLGNAYYEIGDIANTLDAYIKILEINPQHKITQNNIKIVLNNTSGMLQKKTVTSTIPDVLTQLGKIIQLMPTLGEAYHLLGVIYGRELGNIEASMSCFEKAEKCDFEKTAFYYKDLGVAYGVSQNYEKAIPALKKAVELDSLDYLTHINLGVTYQMVGDMKAAKYHLDLGEKLKKTIK